jgi:uncharacterized protein (UPF0303 family)
MQNQLELVRAHEKVTVSDMWDIRSAVALGEFCLHRARASELPILIMVRHLGRTVYVAALPGSAAVNENWAMRKIRLVELFGKSSLLVRLEHEADAKNVYELHSISEEVYAAAGGALTLHNSSGIVGVLVVSGLDQVSDHMFCVEALAGFSVNLNI